LAFRHFSVIFPGENAMFNEDKKVISMPSCASTDDKLFDNKIEVIMALNHHVFNEKEAAFYCRCKVDSIRYHALRSRKLTFCDFTKDGLVFLKSDLDSFLQLSRKQGYRG